MTVNELIQKLQKLPNQDIEVLINVKTYTQAFGVAQVTPFAVDQSYTGATISLTLPEGMSVSKRVRDTQDRSKK
jgi:hypothetical protein